MNCLHYPALSQLFATLATIFLFCRIYLRSLHGPEEEARWTCKHEMSYDIFMIYIYIYILGCPSTPSQTSSTKLSWTSAEFTPAHLIRGSDFTTDEVIDGEELKQTESTDPARIDIDDTEEEEACLVDLIDSSSDVSRTTEFTPSPKSNLHPMAAEFSASPRGYYQPVVYLTNDSVPCYHQQQQRHQEGCVLCFVNKRLKESVDYLTHSHRLK